MEWTDVQITVLSKYAQTAEDVATSIATSGIYVEDYSDMERQVQEIAHIDLIDEQLLQKDRAHVVVHMYVSPDDDIEDIKRLVCERLAQLEVPYAMAVDGVMQEDWEKSWKAYYKPLDIGERLAIVPSWEQYDTDRVKVTLDPGMAFGTGTHETTALCLEVLDSLICAGQSVLDIGTGSGILAIAAAKLGAQNVLGIDIDPMCVRTANENAQLNAVDDKLEIKLGDLSKDVSGEFDVIFANIVANAIMALAPCVPKLLKEDGVFVASGIIDTRCDEVVEAIKNTGLNVCEIKHDRGWVALICRHGAAEN